MPAPSATRYKARRLMTHVACIGTQEQCPGERACTSGPRSTSPALRARKRGGLQDGARAHLEGGLPLVVGELGRLPVQRLLGLGALLRGDHRVLADLLVHALVEVLQVVALQVGLQVRRKVLLVLLGVLLLRGEGGARQAQGSWLRVSGPRVLMLLRGAEACGFGDGGGLRMAKQQAPELQNGQCPAKCSFYPVP